MKKYLPLVVIAGTLFVAFAAAPWPTIRFANLGSGDLSGRFAGLFLFAVLIERTVEVVLSIWLSEDSNKLQSAVQALVRAGKPADDKELTDAQNKLIEFRARTMRWAMPLTFSFGLLIAGLGVRVMDQFLDPMTRPPTGARQLWWFQVADIVFTAALLAGGADPIHKVLDAFRKLMESSSARSSGTASETKN